ncbi:MAG: ABC transporter permease [Blastocatellia bacterium]|nr:ABC transporter permease [Chloracidobacterium sp.]MBL8184260.1 ABC transporter permease [Blastocatellia bacterium]HRJ87600.1 ABC transporter permease [Pyrinomonadaceae bacterium]HRK50557.1 ABC transporter permease [Pyrinomonadaceae bacterium]
MTVATSRLYENLKMAIDTLRSNKLRSFLTIIGVVVGVITVMLISSIISGIQLAVEQQVKAFGTRSIFVYKMDVGIRFGRPSREERMRPNLTLDDALALRGLSELETAVPRLDVSSGRFGNATVVSAGGKQSTSINLMGTLPEIEAAGTEEIVDGRWFTQSENDNKKDVCVIGDFVRETFFPYRNPVGETIEINGRAFTIIGLLQKKEQFLGGGGGRGDQSNTIYLPFESAARIKPNADDIFIMAIAREGRLRQAQDQVEDLLRVRRQVSYGEKNNFSLSTADSIIDQFQSITAGVALAMVVISSIGLLIGGIGVMNIMLVSVTERTREIGIRKALGAKQSDILLQFLIEAGTLTGFGGLVGLLIGWALTQLISLVFPSYVPYWAPPLGFFASVLIGLFFGLFPAWKAARLDPIEALRYE